VQPQSALGIPAARRPERPGTIPGPAGDDWERRERTAQRIENAAGALTTRAVARMRETLPWFAALPADQRATVGLIMQTGITACAIWLRDPGGNADIAADAFNVAPSEMARAVSLQQTVTLVRITVEVAEENLGELTDPGDEPWLHEAVMQFTREIAFAAAFVYARAAERRGTWDARLEAQVVDAIVSGDQKHWLFSRAAALGWTAQEQVAVVAGWAPPGPAKAALQTVHGTARRARVNVLAGVHAGRLVTVLGDCTDALAGAGTMLPAYGEGAVVVGPAVSGLAQAHRSAAVALAGLRAAPMRLDVARPVVADDLLPERVLDGDRLARETLLDEVYRPLLGMSEDIVTTVATYLETAHSVEATARRLFVHPNTVRYRLRRAAEACGRTPTEPRDAYVLQIALALGRRG